MEKNQFLIISEDPVFTKLIQEKLGDSNKFYVIDSIDTKQVIALKNTLGKNFAETPLIVSLGKDPRKLSELIALGLIKAKVVTMIALESIYPMDGLKTALEVEDFIKNYNPTPNGPVDKYQRMNSSFKNRHSSVKEFNRSRRNATKRGR